MHFGLTPEQEMVADTVRTFVEAEIYPHEDEVERLGYVPHELGESIKQRVIDMGFYAPNFPEEVGGGGLDHLTFTPWDDAGSAQDQVTLDLWHSSLEPL